MDRLFPYPKMGHSFLEILHDPLTRRLVGHDEQDVPTPNQFVARVHATLSNIAQDATKHLSFLKIGYSALEAFLQANCTGPPLDFDGQEVVIPPSAMSHAAEFRQEFFKVLEVDGDAVYALTPHIELFWLAQVCMCNTEVAEAGFNGRRARFRNTFIHQKLLLEQSDSLKNQLYQDAEVLEHQLSSRLAFHGAAAEEHFVEFLLERAAIRTYYGDDNLARDDLLRATRTRKFQFALSGVLGKRTKFQDRDISQLVVLARSRDHEPEPYSSRKSSRVEGMDSRKGSQAEQRTGVRTPPFPLSPVHAAHKPENVLLNDDTLLEAIHFKQHPATDAQLSEVSGLSELPHRLATLDPANQPLLFPMDSIILLSIASSISNTSPADGLTREETLPYATRVLDGGSSNWQVYTQALLIRSRLEGYRSRTTERGLLQLQALVDQVIAETTTGHASSAIATAEQASAPATFLPRATPSESASVGERLKYIYQLAPPLRWELESELAARWVSMGGLKTALEIYERLQMHAEIALCLAATDREAEAIQRIRKLLFDGDSESNDKEVTTDPSSASANARERSPLPVDAPRLYCILGDLISDPSYYNRAWTLSNSRFARAQRSLGRHFAKQRDYPAAAEAYKKALTVNRLNTSTWFALGAVYLEMEDWGGAVESFSTVVREESGGEGDAEAWSNLAVALLRLPDGEGEDVTDNMPLDDNDLDQLDVDDDEEAIEDDDDDDNDYGDYDETIEPALDDEDGTYISASPLQTMTSNVEPRPKVTNTHRALAALKRAAQLKRSDARIWDNYLTVAASIPPPNTPWLDIILAQRQLIDVRGKTIGEKAVDFKIMDALVTYVTDGYVYPATADDGDENNRVMKRGGVPRQTCELVDNAVVPLITASPALWLLVSRLAQWRRRPLAALEAQEKAWRVVAGQPGVYDSEKGWHGVVEATERLVRAYEEFGPMKRERTGGRVVEGEGGSGWKFKARSAVRGVLGKGKENWAGSEGEGRLEGVLGGLKG